MSHHPGSDKTLLRYVLQASIVSCVAALVAYLLFLVLLWTMWDSISAVGFAVGASLGVLVGTREMVDPLHFALWARRESSASKYSADSLRPLWRDYPKIYAWIAAAVATLGIGLIVYARPTATLLVAPPIRIIRAAIDGFGTMAIASPGLFYVYVLVRWQRQGEYADSD